MKTIETNCQKMRLLKEYSIINKCNRKTGELGPEVLKSAPVHKSEHRAGPIGRHGSPASELQAYTVQMGIDSCIKLQPLKCD